MRARGRRGRNVRIKKDAGHVDIHVAEDGESKLFGLVIGKTVYLIHAFPDGTFCVFPSGYEGQLNLRAARNSPEEIEIGYR